MTREIDYRRAFKIACDLLNGDVLYGVDSDKIFDSMMDRDGVVTKDSYEEYILNHLQELDHGEYAIKALEQEPPTKNDLGVDAVSRKAVINQIFYSTDNNGDVVLGSALRERIARLPSVTPQLSSELEKNSKKLEKDFGESDCISRADAIRVASGYCHPSNVAKELAKLPSVTPQEPKTGHWIFVGEENEEETRNGNFRYVCSECCHSDVHAKSTEVPYCWYCGAKMAESEGKE